jgi:hypothetical protein
VAQPLEQHVAHRRSWRTHAARCVQFVERQRQRRLAEHHGRPGVTRIHRTADPPVHLQRGALGIEAVADQLEAEVATLALGLVRPAAGLGHASLGHTPQRSDRHGRGPEPNRGADHRSTECATEPRAHAHRLRVAELAAIDEAQQRVAAAHDLPVDRGHDEWRRPSTDVGVAPHTHLIAAIEAWLLTARIQRVGIAHHLAHLGVLARLTDEVEPAGDRAAADSTARIPEEIANPLQLPAALLESAVQHEHPNIRRDGVEPAAIHDASAGGPRDRIVTIDHAPHELWLAGDIAIVRAVGRTRGDGLFTIFGIWADSRAQHLGAGRERVERGAVEAIGEHQRQLGGGRVDLRQRASKLLELVAIASSQREPNVAEAACDQVLGDQRPSEACGSEDDDVVLSHEQDLPQAQPRTTASLAPISVHSAHEFCRVAR